VWRYALLEVYEMGDADEWPDGTPADWIEEGLVGYCDGEARGYVCMNIPLRRLLWWAIIDIPARVRWWIWERRRSDD